MYDTCDPCRIPCYTCNMESCNNKTIMLTILTLSSNSIGSTGCECAEKIWRVGLVYNQWNKHPGNENATNRKYFARDNCETYFVITQLFYASTKISPVIPYFICLLHDYNHMEFCYMLFSDCGFCIATVLRYDGKSCLVINWYQQLSHSWEI